MRNENSSRSNSRGRTSEERDRRSGRSEVGRGSSSGSVYHTLKIYPYLRRFFSSFFYLGRPGSRSRTDSRSRSKSRNRSGSPGNFPPQASASTRYEQLGARGRERRPSIREIQFEQTRKKEQEHQEVWRRAEDGIQRENISQGDDIHRKRDVIHRREKNRKRNIRRGKKNRPKEDDDRRRGNDRRREEFRSSKDDVRRREDDRREYNRREENETQEGHKRSPVRLV